MCIIFPPEISPSDTLLVDCKKTENTRSLIYKNVIEELSKKTLMGFLINGEVLKIKTSSLDEYKIYYDKIEEEFYRLGYSTTCADGCGVSFRNFENKDFIVKTVKIENAKKYLTEMIKEFNLDDKSNKIFNKTFLTIIENYENTFYNKKNFSNLHLVIVKFKEVKTENNFNAIELIYKTPDDKHIIMPTAHEVSEKGYLYYVNGYADNIKDICLEQFDEFSNGNKEYKIKVENKLQNDKEKKKSFIFTTYNKNFKYEENIKFNLPETAVPYKINGFSLNNKIFYMYLIRYKNTNNFNFYLEVF